jgi:glucose-6-phosphate isomerase
MRAGADFPWSQATTLEGHSERLAATPLADLTALPGRRANCSASGAGWTLDYSRQLLDAGALHSLLEMAQEADIDAARSALFGGERINHTEGRAVLHTLLRAREAPAGLADEFEAVRDCRARLAERVDQVRNGKRRGFSGKTFTDVVNIGIGGSDLGPRMACQALAPFHQDGLDVHFVANIDPSELAQALAPLDPARTLFILCSKTLRTEETLHNARAARAWLTAASGSATAVADHFLAVSTNLEGAADFGIPAENILPMWDWVGGRYSLWSAIGWSIAFAVGNDHFDELLAGAADMDAHFLNAPPAENLPLLLSLLEIWAVNFLGARSHAVIPYDHNLRRLPAFLQQLTMESNGKRTNRSGLELNYATAPVLWGEEGTNGQHSFHQLLHQGTLLCPVDFVLPLHSSEPDRDRHARLVANAIAQAEALANGRNAEEAMLSLVERGVDETAAERLAPHLVIPGNRPCNILSCEQLTPARVGALVALYEHRTFCSGHLWQINSFDQFGVELGKALSSGIYEGLTGPERPGDLSQVDAWRRLNS